MGQLLLQGWAMLEACCDDCNVPLMRNRAKDSELCVECGKDYKAPPKPPVKAEVPKSTEKDA